MKDMTIMNISIACGGLRYNCGDMMDDENIGILKTEVTGITIDSRQVKEGYLFIPLVGARADGHDYIEQVMEQGALCCLSERELVGYDKPYILVKSCHQALKDIAKFYRKSSAIKVVGITGSVGKTSTKEMVASVLSTKYNVLKTAGNFNNEIGLPLTLFNLREEHEVAVLEMGISEFGEMSRLTDVASPDVAIITNIGACHLESLIDLDGVLRAKSEIFESMNEKSSIVLNGLDAKLSNVADVNGKKPLFFGLDDSYDIYASEIENLGLEGTRCNIHIEDKVINVTISIPGEHMVLNALAGALVGIQLGLTPEEIKAGIEALVPVSGRNNIIKGSKYTVIDDCYNANPVSMKASLDVINTATTRKVAILGDMGELGTNEVAMHKEVGAHAATLDLDLLCCIGNLAEHIAAAALEGNAPCDVAHFPTKADFIAGMNALLEDGDTILVKSSNFMKFSELVELLTN